MWEEKRVEFGFAHMKRNCSWHHWNGENQNSSINGADQSYYQSNLICFSRFYSTISPVLLFNPATLKVPSKDSKNMASHVLHQAAEAAHNYSRSRPVHLSVSWVYFPHNKCDAGLHPISSNIGVCGGCHGDYCCCCSTAQAIVALHCPTFSRALFLTLIHHFSESRGFIKQAEEFSLFTINK